MNQKSKKLAALFILTLWIVASIYLLNDAERTAVSKDINLYVVKMISSGGL